MVERRDNGPSLMTIISIESCYNADKVFGESSVLRIGWGGPISVIHVYTKVLLGISLEFSACRADKDDVVC